MKRTRVNKTPIDPGRIRQLPCGGFSWIDRRLVREGFLEVLPREAALLYFFLLAVSDAKGLSFYADPTLTRLLKLTAEELTQARFWLEKANLALYRDPLYQVLSLPSKRPSLRSATTPRPTSTQASSSRRGGDPMSLKEFFALAAARERSDESASRSES